MMKNEESKRLFKIPRLNLKHKALGYLGAEWYGCMNTGQRARISFLGRMFNTYLVGSDNDVHSALETAEGRKQIIAGKRVIKVKTGTTVRKVYQFKSRAAAVEKWHEFNQKVLDFNTSERERVRKYNEAVAKGDFKLALKYAD